MHRMQKIMAFAALVISLSLALGSTPAWAGTAPVTVKPGHRAFGMTYGQWLGTWWQHFLELPTSANPLVGTGDRCDQVHDVLFPVFAPGYDARCTVNPGTPVFLMLWSQECSTVEPPPYYGADEAALRACARTIFDDPPDVLSVTVDGRPVPNVLSYVSVSPMFHIDLPAKNLLGVGATSGEAVAAGWSVMLRPLRPGRHVIENCLQDPNAGVFNGCATLTLLVRAR